ncbi:MAG TPA: hypothetical protein VGH91_04705 [Gammaproteobacteria bacterium]
MTTIRILPHVRSDQAKRMAAETGHTVRQVNGHPCLVPANEPPIPLFLRRHRPAPHQPEPPEAA